MPPRPHLCLSLWFCDFFFFFVCACFTFHYGDVHSSPPGSGHAGQTRAVSDRWTTSTGNHASPGIKQQKHMNIQTFVLKYEPQDGAHCKIYDLWISGGSRLILALCSITSFATFPLGKQRSRKCDHLRLVQKNPRLSRSIFFFFTKMSLLFVSKTFKTLQAFHTCI